MHTGFVVWINSLKLSNQYFGKKQSASVVTIHSCSATCIAVVMASFLGECVNRLLGITLKFCFFLLKKEVIISEELSVDSSSIKIISKSFVG